ncbi:MAG TPA: hypothetical protein VII07_11105, partial [Bradyrhizobium sp.]
MDVIIRSKPRFRVNARRITKVETPKNYGSVDEFVTLLRAMPALAIGEAGRLPVSPYEIRGARGRADGMATRIFLPLLSSHRFETMPAATTNKTRFSRGHQRGNPMPIVQADRLTR